MNLPDHEPLLPYPQDPLAFLARHEAALRAGGSNHWADILAVAQGILREQATDGEIFTPEGAK